MSTEELLAEIEAILHRPSPAVTNLIEADAIARFAEAVGEPIVDANGALVVPPTFLCSLRYRRPPMPGGAEDKMVILDNALTLERVPVVGERITTTATFTEARQRGPLIVLKLACRYTDEQNAEIAAITCSWMIDLEADRVAAAWPAAAIARPELLAPSVTEQASVNGHGGVDPRPTRAWDSKPEAEIPPLVKAPLSTLQFVKYAGASHDFNPIHYDSHFAARAGFPDAIAPGLMKLAFFGEHMMLWSGRWGRIRRLEAKYKGVDLPGAELTARASVKQVDDALITLNLSLTDQHDEAKTVGSATIEVISRP